MSELSFELKAGFMARHKRCTILPKIIAWDVMGWQLRINVNDFLKIHSTESRFPRNVLSRLSTPYWLNILLQQPASWTKGRQSMWGFFFHFSKAFNSPTGVGLEDPQEFLPTQDLLFLWFRFLMQWRPWRSQLEATPCHLVINCHFLPLLCN